MDDAHHGGHHSAEPPPSTPVLIGIALLVALYFGILMLRPGLLGPAGVPEPHREHTEAEFHLHDDEAPAEHHEADSHASDHDDHAAADTGHHGSEPAMWSVTPFVLLLGAIALLPLIRSTAHWWESNLHRFYLAAGLGLITLAYYMLIYPEGGLGKVFQVLDHAVFDEYIPFIVLLFSLYTISGGIRIEGDLVASPRTNSLFLLVGGALASFIGTTGAAMLLIRPLLDTNDERKWVQHTVVFFIIVVCNCGGCLLPIGDPPLFLGYLKGVPFMWTFANLWKPWLVTNALIIVMFYFIDRFFYYPRETKRDITKDVATTRPLRVHGLWPNAALLLGVILSIALLDSSKHVPGTQWYPWPFLREIVQLVLVGISLAMGSFEIRKSNKFNYHAIIEVAALFIGIFVCMQPAIEILHVRGGQLGLETPMQMFWYTGALSAVLDNAPTYVVFYETAAADARFVHAPFYDLVTNGSHGIAEARRLLQAISLGAVFMGAMTYIGNGPNFMVRAIAEQSGVTMPSFFGYVIRYTIPFLIPILLLVTWLFFA